MPKVRYQRIRFAQRSLEIIEKANEIIAEYEAQGFNLTLRQLYYQFVSRGFIPNSQKEYSKLGSIINDARLAGMVDWDSITDRTRFVRRQSHWDGAKDILKSAAASFHVDMWETQCVRPEVWIEKDALVGVIQGVCEEYDVPYLSCRGYTSQSEMWGSAQRMRQTLEREKKAVVILHFGDHDPSGIDMSRDIRDRLSVFTGVPVMHEEFDGGKRAYFERLALNMPQVETYNPPPNPAKMTDSRYAGYIVEHGHESWELDALEPSVIVDLIRGSLTKLIDVKAWNERATYKTDIQLKLNTLAGNWMSVEDWMDNNDDLLEGGNQ